MYGISRSSHVWKSCVRCWRKELASGKLFRDKLRARFTSTDFQYSHTFQTCYGISSQAHLHPDCSRLLRTSSHRPYIFHFFLHRSSFIHHFIVWRKRVIELSCPCLHYQATRTALEPEARAADEMGRENHFTKEEIQ